MINTQPGSTSHRIKLKFDLKSGEQLLPAETILSVIRANSWGARAVDGCGSIHVIRAEDFDWV